MICTDIKFTEPLYQLGQTVKVTAVGSKCWGVITGMNYQLGDYQQWTYRVVLFISKREGFNEIAYEYSEQEIKNV